jgi:hypothetical protein
MNLCIQYAEDEFKGKFWASFRPRLPTLPGERLPSATCRRWHRLLGCRRIDPSKESTAMTDANLPAPLPSAGQMLIYRDGSLRLQVRLDGQTVWLTQAGMAELFQTSVPNINIHIRNILEEGELEPDSVIKEYLTTAADGKNYRTMHYNLDMILAVGYRVRSPRGTQFRQWATAQLRELLVKGFVLDDERIKAGQTIGRDYFDRARADQSNRNLGRAEFPYKLGYVPVPPPASIRRQPELSWRICANLR